MVCAKSGFWRLRDKKKTFFVQVDFRYNNSFSRSPSGVSRYNNFFRSSSGRFQVEQLCFLARRAILGTRALFSPPSGDFRYNNFFCSPFGRFQVQQPFFPRPSGDFRYNKSVLLALRAILDTTTLFVVQVYNRTNSRGEARSAFTHFIINKIAA